MSNIMFLKLFEDYFLYNSLIFFSNSSLSDSETNLLETNKICSIVGVEIVFLNSSFLAC